MNIKMNFPLLTLFVSDQRLSFCKKYFKKRGVIGRRKTPWTGDTTNPGSRPRGGPDQDKNTKQIMKHQLLRMALAMIPNVARKHFLKEPPGLSGLHPADAQTQRSPAVCHKGIDMKTRSSPPYNPSLTCVASEPIARGLRSARMLRFALMLLGAALAEKGAAQGIPEPSMVMYGVVRNTQDIDRLRIVFGNLTWVFEPVGGGTPISVSAALTNINDQFSYVLRVPCETEVAGLTLSSNVLRLGSSYIRTNVFFNVTNRATLVEPTQASFALSSTSRGRVERVDLDISIVLEDLDGNGLPDAWERLYFGGTGVDPFADPDRDGMNNLAEYKAGTNPNDFQSQFRFVKITSRTNGVMVEWSSVTNRIYSVLRSSDVQTGFQVLAGNRQATPPLNSYLDTTAAPPGPYFYLLRLQE